ncbi:MAG: ketopantoate reductase family protein [Firmicutes bacterium]|nr:ketopantoate reductase family protein [Bacillota bacterium]
MKKINNVAIVGMGALGILFGKMIAEGLGEQAVRYVMDGERFARYEGSEVVINGQPWAVPVAGAEAAGGTEPADLVMVAVKGTGLEAALDVMKNCVGPETIIISVLNGITSEEIIGQRYGREKLVHCIAQGMDAMRFGNQLNYMKPGQLHIGLAEGELQENLDALVEFFERAGVPYILEEDIMYRMWSKFMLNVGGNQTCMAFGTTYGGILTEGTEANLIFIGAMREVIALAAAEGICIGEKELKEYIEVTRSLNPDGTPSMGQDRINRKPSEVELFAGTVIRMAEKHGIPVPVNRYLYRKVKEIEAEY